jgi:hypothetical protein
MNILVRKIAKQSAAADLREDMINQQRREERKPKQQLYNITPIHTDNPQLRSIA